MFPRTDFLVYDDDEYYHGINLNVIDLFSGLGYGYPNHWLELGNFSQWNHMIWYLHFLLDELTKYFAEIQSGLRQQSEPLWVLLKVEVTGFSREFPRIRCEVDPTTLRLLFGWVLTQFSQSISLDLRRCRSQIGMFLSFWFSSVSKFFRFEVQSNSVGYRIGLRGVFYCTQWYGFS